VAPPVRQVRDCGQGIHRRFSNARVVTWLDPRTAVYLPLPFKGTAPDLERADLTGADLEGVQGDLAGSGYTWQAIESVAGDLPRQYEEFVAAYGPGVIGGFLQVLHPLSQGPTMLDTMAQMGPLYKGLVPNDIPHELYPCARAMVQWAQTREGDACFLVPGPDGAWRIGVWFRQWAQREEYDHDVPSWLAPARRLAVSGATRKTSRAAATCRPAAEGTLP
jgi:hypothetical protein